jgi:hypothetical protein
MVCIVCARIFFFVLEKQKRKKTSWFGKGGPKVTCFDVHIIILQEKKIVTQREQVGLTFVALFLLFF